VTSSGGRSARQSLVQIRAKLGTHPTALYFVRDRDEPPSVGDRAMVRSDHDVRVSEWTMVHVDMIKFGDFFYLDLI